eukprot:scaffold36837_cov69-Attheya_sp.AAC.1
MPGVPAFGIPPTSHHINEWEGFVEVKQCILKSNSISSVKFEIGFRMLPCIYNIIWQYIEPCTPLSTLSNHVLLLLIRISFNNNMEFQVNSVQQST